jgi:hypothetical protein
LHLARHTRVGNRHGRRVPASTLPDFGSPDTTAFVSLVVGCFTTAYSVLRRDSRVDVMWAGFVGTFLGAGIGLLVYAIGLFTGLY